MRIIPYRLGIISFIWNKIPLPDQVKRLAIIFIILISGLITARHFLIPLTFGERGHYRASAVDSIAALPIQFVGQETCIECHDEQGKKKQISHHQHISCEVCHGAGNGHALDPAANVLSAPRQRGLCPTCHQYNASKPSGFPQININTHNPLKPCMTCHDPHDPKPPHVPEECGACHGNIARTKALSHHAALSCVQCHKTPKEHKINPGKVNAEKPTDRAFCGTCHGEGAKKSREIPLISLETHGAGYVCWQCHYPHYPEAL